jgi:hypothetical protein
VHDVAEIGLELSVDIASFIVGAVRGPWLPVIALAVACVPPGSTMPMATESTSMEGSTGTSATPDPGSTSTGSPPSTFGLDAPADEGTEAGFVPPLDLACAGPADGTLAHCALCDVREQGCLDDFRCVAWADDGGDAWNGTKCIGTALAPVGVREACTVVDALVSGRDDCATGSMCWDADPVTLEGTCVPFCAPEGDEPACPPGTRCMLDGLDVLALCLPPCQPLDPASCPADAACRFMPASDAAFCIPNDGGRVLSPTIQCGSDDEECPADRVCVSAATYGGCGSPSCCTAWCDRGQPDADAQCAAGRPEHVCVPVFDREPAPAGYADLGVCAVPPR